MTANYHPWRLAGWTAAAALLLVPLVAMQFTQEVKWDWRDFATMGTLLLVIGGSFEFLARQSASRAYRAGAALALAGGFLLIWVNLAVGFIGSEHGDANLMFAGVLAVGCSGAIVGRFRPAGMARAMVATAVAQVAVAVIASAARLIPVEDGISVELVATAGFAALWLAAAWLFARAARA